METKKGMKITWKGVNKELTGVVIGAYAGNYVVRIDGSSQCMLVDMKEARLWTK